MHLFIVGIDRFKFQVLVKMAKQRVTYETLKGSLARRVRELNNLVDKPDTVERAERVKVNDLEADKIKLIRGAAEYVESLTEDAKKKLSLWSNLSWLTKLIRL